MIYTGIGSRETPQEALDLIHELAFRLARKGYICRTGGAQGADNSFYLGASSVDADRVEIYLPWEGFNDWTEEHLLFVRRSKPQQEAYQIASNYHPGWNHLTWGGKSLHARNVHQVYGIDVTKPEYSKFIICWTPKGKSGGGTGQAIRIAKDKGIPVYDLGDPVTYRLFRSLVL